MTNLSQRDLFDLAGRLGFKTDDKWTENLYRRPSGRCENTRSNIASIFHNDQNLNQLYWDVFRKLDAAYQDIPMFAIIKDDPISDHSLTRMASYISQMYGFNVEEALISKYVHEVAASNPRNRVKEVLQTLTWDNVPRLDEFFIRCAGAEDSPYTRAVTSRTFIGAVARAYSPGCKLDTVMLLEGGQGTKKSTLLSEIGSIAGNHYCHCSRITPSHKDTMQSISQTWFVVIDEFDTLAKHEIAELKAFITSQKDTFRAPYAVRAAEHKRQCIFVGSINSTANGYLSDSTGGRRFWPIAITHTIDMPYVKEVKNQIWAEAVHRYKAGENWWIDESAEPELVANFKNQQDERQTEDSWQERVHEWIKAQTADFTIDDILESVIAIPFKDRNHAHRVRVGHILTRLGMIKRQISNGKRVYNPRKVSDWTGVLNPVENDSHVGQQSKSK